MARLVEALRPTLEPAARAFEAYTQRRYRVLFFTLLLMLAVNPIGDALGVDRWLLSSFVNLNLVVAAAGISNRPSIRSVLVVVSVVAVIVRVLPEESLPTIVFTASECTLITVLVMATIGAVRFALRSTAVDAEHVAAALSAYLLAGLFFAVLFVLVDVKWPGSVVEVAAGPGRPLTLDTAVYYSFVTLATLGYGDVVPRGVARGLAIVEAIGAQLYLTVTVARLVGLHSWRPQPPRPGNGGDA